MSTITYGISDDKCRERVLPVDVLELTLGYESWNDNSTGFKFCTATFQLPNSYGTDEGVVIACSAKVPYRELNKDKVRYINMNDDVMPMNTYRSGAKSINIDITCLSKSYDFLAVTPPTIRLIVSRLAW